MSLKRFGTAPYRLQSPYRGYGLPQVRNRCEDNCPKGSLGCVSRTVGKLRRILDPSRLQWSEGYPRGLPMGRRLRIAKQSPRIVLVDQRVVPRVWVDLYAERPTQSQLCRGAPAALPSKEKWLARSKQPSRLLRRRNISLVNPAGSAGTH